METAYSILLTLHIVVGSMSLITFWIPVFTKKGGDIHLKIGKIYVFLMWLVVVSAFLLCVLNLFRGRIFSAAFLGYLSILTAHPLWYGIVVLKHKQDLPKRVKIIKLSINWIQFLGGAGLVIWSLFLFGQGPAILLMVFGILGVVSSLPIIFPKREVKYNWLFEHIQGMVISGIAAYTAFFAFGGGTFFGSLFSEYLVVIPWILPTVFGTIIIKQYKRKMSIA